MEVSAGIGRYIVDFIYDKTGFHSIVCNEQAVIIADSAGTRIGKTHGGAKQIIQDKLEIFKVTAEMATNSNGTMKEGTSLPIIFSGQIIGTFGITGDLNYTLPIANIAAELISVRLRDEATKETLQGYVSTLNDVAQDTVAAIEEITASSEELASTSETVATSAVQATNYVQNTNNILDLLAKVAQQTKMLGLNAAIEASRAGEYGRSFLVVAKEVSKLAEDSRNSSEEIVQILGTLKDVIERVSNDIQQTSVIANEQSKALQDIARLADSVQDVVTSLKDIAEQL
ncbi:sugar diacid recognition domain-containing protein [Desulfuribacillus alkaliarsenatis]|uniref:Methyl-accepting transducer domain-containing protein n=1 Tax=Desulfuribacillus alkaliarsenatis TaxID=766136 RepID=A0A1E5FZ42_9FIRM|nr:sugar diacid recognition domain-containing protein [Desulfuribacillus alkaliarsenatis]OEF95841.1 hypothetical protein BHF68_10620 [Desulfuribacillus alkaliarsenatis]